MRIAIMGTGGMGGYFGARLAAVGNDVTFIARGAHLAAIKADGLRLIGPRGDTHIKPAQATDDPDSVGPVDCVLFCVKLYDAETGAAAIRPMLRPDTMVISTLNGVDGPDRIAAVIGPGHVLGGAAYAAAHIEQPGVVSYRSDMSKLAFGELDGSRSPRAIAFQEACTGTGFVADLSSDIRATLWEKFVLLATNAALTAVTRKPAAVVYGDPDLKDLAVRLMQEVLAIGQAEGVNLASDIIERSVALTETFPPDMYASMYHDLAAGKPLELESFSGLIARLGKKHGIATPHHATIYACLKPYVDGTR
ncbi:MAG: 2-dehydropantoate 2-reductase [Hyphomicrobiaceae bacterium]|nr:2-dehydropantoate 2-reductase [Hyphomicrobiaceae bacterium]